MKIRVYMQLSASDIAEIFADVSNQALFAQIGSKQ